MNEPPWLEAAFGRVDALVDDRLPHALLIQGPGGWGEARVANALAARLLGEDAAMDMRDVAHPDLRWLEPDDGVVKIDAVRGAIEFLMQTPKLAGRKIAVICDAERMNLNAANALLKTLEEPPAESFLALASGAPGRLLPTVRSRCQRIDIRAAAMPSVMAWLATLDVDRDSAGYLAVEYGGAPFAILEAAKREQPPLWPTLVDIAKAPAQAAKAAESRRDEDLADFAARWLRILHWLLRRVAKAHIGPLLDFAAELMQVREAALFNTGLNRPMQIERLFLLWADIAPNLPNEMQPKVPAA